MRTWVRLLPVVGLAACAGAPPPEAPKPSAAPSVVAVPPPAPPAPTAAPAPEIVRLAIGSTFSPDAEEPLPAGAVARCGTTRMRAASPGAVGLSKKGTLWAVDRVGSRWVLRDVTRGVDVASLPGGRDAALAPDAGFAVVASEKEDGVLAFFSLPDGEPRGEVKVPLPESTKRGFGGKPYKARAHIVSLAASPDGAAVVAVTSDDSAHLVDPAGHKLVKTVKIPAKSRLAGLGRGAGRAVFEHMESEHYLLSVHAPVFGYTVIDLRSGATVRKETFKRPPLDPQDPQALRIPEHGDASLRISVDGTKLYRSELGEITAIELPGGKETPVMGSRASGSSSLDLMRLLRPDRFVLAADGRRAVVGDRLVDLVDRVEVEKVVVALAAISADGEQLATRSGNRFELYPEPAQVRDGHDAGVESLAFLADNHLVGVASRPIVWDTASCVPVLTPDLQVDRAAAASKKVVSLLFDDGATLMNDRRELQKLVEPGPVYAAALSPDGDMLYLAEGDSYDGEGRLVARDPADARGARRQERVFPFPIRSIAVAPDGGEIGVTIGKNHGSGPATLHLLSPAGLSTTAQIDVRRPGDVAFAGPNRLVHSADGSGISVRALPSLDAVSHIHHGSCCHQMAVSPDGKLVAGAEGRSFFVWEVEARRLVAHVKAGHRERIGALAFSADSRFLATGSADTTILLWDVAKLGVPPLPDQAETRVTGAAEAKRFFESRDALFAIKPDGTLESARPALKLRPPPLKKVTKIASGYSSHCVIAEGKVRCWGSTRGGVLGVPEKPGKDRWTAAEVATPTTLPVNDPVDLQMGTSYACALERGGDLICWGLLDHDEPAAAPGKVLGGVRGFAFGSDGVCAAGNDGSVHCRRKGDHTPKPLPVKDAVAVARGTSHIVVLDEAGSVHATGEGGHDQLGDDTGLDRTGMVTAKGVQGAIAVAAGWHSTCALTSTQAVFCWGWIGGAQLARPTRIAALDGATAVRIDSDAVCGLRADRVDCVKFPYDTDR